MTYYTHCPNVCGLNELINDSSRRYGFYLYKVVLINVLMSIWAWSVFWMPGDEFGDRVGVSLTLFLASVAFLFVISDKLPKVDFLTALDKMILFSFLMLFGTAVESFAVLVTITKNPEMAAQIDYFSRFCFPIVFVFVNFFFVLRANRSTIKKEDPIHSNLMD